MRNLIALAIGIFMLANLSFANTANYSYTTSEAESSINLFVDPANKVLFIDCDQEVEQIQELLIWDRYGNQVLKMEGTKSAVDNILELEAYNLTDDWYFIELTSDKDISWFEVSL